MTPGNPDETDLPRFIAQPGPAGPAVLSVPASAYEVEFELPAGQRLDRALADAVKQNGIKGGCLRLRDVALSSLGYVIPDRAPDDTHVAWYSPTIEPDMPGRITDAAVIIGFHKGAPWYHCHGQWSDARGAPAMGHLLPETCVLARDVRLRGLGFSGACFQRVSDPETGFDLFKPEANGPAIANPDARLVRIGPNVELGGALIALCRDAGWSRASVHGVGSLIGARFQDGSRMNSFATEFMMREGRILNAMNETGACAKIDISLVGLDGSFMSGRLAAHRNPVLITAELVLKRL